MYTTSVLRNDLDHHKEFMWSKYNADKVLSRNNQNKVGKQITGKMRYAGCIDAIISKGAVHLPLANEIYTLEALTKTSYDLVLPNNPKFLDWIVLSILTDDVITSVDFDQFPLIRIKSKENIMSHNEDLICDVPFMSLRLTYTGVTDGWVIT